MSNVELKMATSEEKGTYFSAVQRMQYLRMVGLCDGSLQITSKELKQWCEMVEENPEIAQLDHYAEIKLQELKLS